jgi:hypothetical protein
MINILYEGQSDANKEYNLTFLLKELYNINETQIHEFDPTELFFSKENVFRFGIKLQDLINQTCSICKQLYNDSYDHGKCPFTVRQRAFWIDNYDCIFLYWSTRLINIVFRIEKESYNLYVGETIQ